MGRRIGFSSERLQVVLPCTLLDELAPKSAGFLWQLAGCNAELTTQHAMWTGPELSIPLPASSLPPGADCSGLPAENATAFPRKGDIVVAWLAAGSTRGLPPGDFFDIGVFYDEGGRLLMPFGWLQANVAARVEASDLSIALAVARDIREHGTYHLRLAQL